MASESEPSTKKIKTAADVTYIPSQCKFGSYCSASDCTNTKKKNSTLTFFNFPKEETRFMEWVIRSQRTDMLKVGIKLAMQRRRCLCEEHFEPSQFMNPKDKGVFKPSGKHLIHTALPTIFRYGKLTLPVTRNNNPSTESIEIKTENELPELNFFTSPETTNLDQMNDPKENIINNLPVTQLNDESEITSNSDKLKNNYQRVFTINTTSTEMEDDVTEILPDTTNNHVQSLYIGNGTPIRLSDKLALLKSLENRNSSSNPDSFLRIASVESLAPILTKDQETILKLRRLVKSQQQKFCRLKKKNEQLKKEIEIGRKDLSREEYIDMSGRYLSGQCRTFFISQIKMFNKVRQERKWTKDDKEFAINLYRTSTKVYGMLRNVFALPTIRTLNRHVEVSIAEPFPDVINDDDIESNINTE